MEKVERIEKILTFLEEIEQFKHIYRATYLADHARHENDAEHTWHMAMFALLLHKELEIEVDLAHALKLILTHDLVEIYAGDTFAYDIEGHSDKQEREEQAAQRLFALLPVEQHEQIYNWWHEFEAQQTSEAKFARAVDKLQAVAQNVFSQGRAWQERGIRPEQPRQYNQQTIALDPALAQVFELLYERASREDLWKAGIETENVTTNTYS